MANADRAAKSSAPSSSLADQDYVCQIDPLAFANYGAAQMTPCQCRAARKLIGMSILDLARAPALPGPRRGVTNKR